MKLNRKVLLLTLCLLILCSVSFAKTCLNPYVGENSYCQDESAVPEGQCCPDTASYYGQSRAPQDKLDCLENFFVDDTGTACDIGCCYVPDVEATSCVQNSPYRGYCVFLDGTFSLDQTCQDIIVDGDRVCNQGCCCFEGTGGDESNLYTRGFCQNSLDGKFVLGITDIQLCADTCEELSGESVAGQTECSDGEDNDLDGLFDMADPDCESPTDPSEGGGIHQCNDGFDNDQDGGIDKLDPCCLDPTSTDEQSCDLPDCSEATLLGSDCNCHGVLCPERNYCCDGGCQSVLCGLEDCTTGERRACSTPNPDTGCADFEYCVNGQWSGTCRADPTCDATPEVCTNGIDDDVDGFADCNDIDCNGLTCDKTEATCKARGYDDTFDSSFVCCYAGDINDCDSDGVKETCGQCACEEFHPAPEITDIKRVATSLEVDIAWKLSCSGIFYLYRCTSDSFADCAEILGPTGLTQYRDEVQPNTDLCYYVEAEYQDGTRVPSNITCFTAGDRICLETPYEHFCLRGDDGFEYIRYTCDQDSMLIPEEDCSQTKGLNYVCAGPYDDDQTECVFQSQCDLCNSPLGMFGNLATSMTSLLDGSGSNVTQLCKDLSSCYMDYTPTVVDAFQPCSDVSSCYDYTSQFACSGQPEGKYNNKCLPRDCAWKPLEPGLNTGICSETSTVYEQCSLCDSLAVCDKDTCRSFGDCFLQPSGACVSATTASCANYYTSTDCTGGQNVIVDVQYDSNGTRIGGTHKITRRSKDELGIGLCYYDSKCFKDANGDGIADPFPDDVTPPTTRLHSPAKVASLNLTLSAQDQPVGDGSAMGVAETYICLAQQGHTCYPDTLLSLNNASGLYEITFGNGQGIYDIYYYSTDFADNLEEVQKATIEVDRTPPIITITPFLKLDTRNFINSSITFSISSSETVVCSDVFEEGDFPNELNLDRGKDFVTQYTNLDDGSYEYAVICTDLFGNVQEEFITVRLNADTAIYDPKPFGIIDNPQLTLSVFTEEDTSCKYGTVVAPYPDLTGIFSKEPENDDFFHFAPETISTDGTHSYDVKCRLSDRVADDEIQFILDSSPPRTFAVDTLGNDFNFSLFYSGVEDTIYLDCVDVPRNGFGCGETKYCISNRQCEPDTRYQKTSPLTFNRTISSNDFLCYRSIENSVDGRGGKSEPIKCHQIKIDEFDPQIVTDRLESHTSSSKPLKTFDTLFLLTGKVNDPDAATGLEDTLVTITVVSSTNATTVINNVTANPSFEAQIPLSSGLNAILITATDRSGATVTHTYYIEQNTFVGKKLDLVSPSYGISGTFVFDFIAEVFTDIAQCRYSFSDSPFLQMLPLQPIPTEQTKHQKRDFSLEGFAPNVPVDVFTKCELLSGEILSSTFELTVDNSTPLIEGISMSNSNGREPPTIIERPLETNLTIATDDKTRCKYSTTAGQRYQSMTSFTNFHNQTLTRTNTIAFYNLQDKNSYTYYFRCENGAGTISDEQSFTFRTDTSFEDIFELVAPVSPTTSADNSVIVKTLKTTSDCTFTVENSSTQTLSSAGDTHSGSFTFGQGENTLTITCNFIDGPDSEVFTIKVDSTPPSVPVIDDGNYSVLTTKLGASWKSEDNESKIVQYKYGLGSTPGATDVVALTNTTTASVLVKGLNLTENATYYWTVQAENELGLASALGVSDGVTIGTEIVDDTHSPPNSTIIIDSDGIIRNATVNKTDNGSIITEILNQCFNEKLDGVETDLDCGGGDCDPCLDGRQCIVNQDCASQSCGFAGVCKAASCNDTILNGGESDVDCGGVCGGCTIGSSCIISEDCEDGLYCTVDNTCAEPSCFDLEINGDEEGIDCGGSCSTPCSQNLTIPVSNQSPQNVCTVRVSGGEERDADCDKMPDFWERDNGFDYSNAADARGDADNDGASNLQEFVDGTDPRDASSVIGSGSGGSSLLWWIVGILVILILIGGGSYYYYESSTKGKEPLRPAKGPTMPHKQRPKSMPPPPPKKPTNPVHKGLQRMLWKERTQKKKEKRKQMVSTFESKEKESKKSTLEKLPASKPHEEKLVPPVSKHEQRIEQKHDEVHKKLDTAVTSESSDEMIEFIKSNAEENGTVEGDRAENIIEMFLTDKKITAAQASQAVSVLKEKKLISDSDYKELKKKFT